MMRIVLSLAGAMIVDVMYVILNLPNVNKGALLLLCIATALLPSYYLYKHTNENGE